MALILPNSALLLAPKTGSTWCHKVLFEAGLVRGVLYSPESYPHPSAAQVKVAIGDRFLFCFVRHPVSWLRSFWAAAVRHKGQGVDRERFAFSPWRQFSNCEAPTFAEFVACYLRECPGAVGEFFHRYTVGAQFVGRQENLKNDLRSGLLLAERVDVGQAETPRINDAQFMDGIANLSSKAETAVCEAERDFIAEFYP